MSQIGAFLPPTTTNRHAGQITGSRDADRVQIPGKGGYLGILPGHAPLITELMIGEISFSKGGNTQYYAVSWGFAEVLPDKVTILADTAERAEQRRGACAGSQGACGAGVEGSRSGAGL